MTSITSTITPTSWKKLVLGYWNPYHMGQIIGVHTIFGWTYYHFIRIIELVPNISLHLYFPLLYSSPSVWLLHKKHRQMPHCREKSGGTMRFSRARAPNVACVEWWFLIRSSWTIRGSVSIAKSANVLKRTDHNTSNFASHCRHPKIGGKNVLTVLAIATKISSVTSGSITKCP